MNLTPLTKTIAITIPSTVNVSGAAPETVIAAALAAVFDLFTTLFGGATATKAQGAWKSPTQGVVIEDVTVVTAFATDDAFEAGRPQVLAFARKLAHDMGQEAVALQLNGAMYFIEPGTDAAAVAA